MLQVVFGRGYVRGDMGILEVVWGEVQMYVTGGDGNRKQEVERQAVYN